MIQLGFLIDINKCLGCHSCAIACRQEHQNFQDVEMRKITRVETGEGQFYYLSLACNHCESPECFRVCPQGTYKKRRDGVVLHDPRKCTGCCTCVRACPFGAPHLSLKTGKVDKCDFCVQRLEKNLEPACVAACPTGALKMVDILGNNLPYSARAVAGMADILLTNPSVRFVVPRKAENSHSPAEERTTPLQPGEEGGN